MKEQKLKLKTKIPKIIKSVPLYIKPLVVQIIHNIPITEICWDLRVFRRAAWTKLCQETNVLADTSNDPLAKKNLRRLKDFHKYSMPNDILMFSLVV